MRKAGEGEHLFFGTACDSYVLKLISKADISLKNKACAHSSAG